MLHASRVIAAVGLMVGAAGLLEAQGGRAGGDSAQAGRGGGRGRGGPPIPATGEALARTRDLVEIEMMTWPEVKRAIRELGKTTAIVYNGGTEQRGPQNVNGGHTLMAREMAKAVALKLGNALVAPVLAYSPAGVSAEMPGSIGISAALYKAVNMEIAEALLRQGFKTVAIMGDNGGGQAQLGEVATELSAKYAAEGKYVYHIPDAYYAARTEFAKILVQRGLPCASHAGLNDTSNMVYLGQDKGWVRMELLPTAVGNYVPCPDAPVDSVAAARPRVNNGINGDARKASPEIGKIIFDLKVNLSVAQIQKLTAGQK
ncbi:MAG: creatininase family protein [Gemmatimonadetes bacterium]|nr:creatininase family protein [Gemmatimonadota bacterium]